MGAVPDRNSSAIAAHALDVIVSAREMLVPADPAELSQKPRAMPVEAFAVRPATRRFPVVVPQPVPAVGMPSLPMEAEIITTILFASCVVMAAFGVVEVPVTALAWP